MAESDHMNNLDRKWLKGNVAELDKASALKAEEQFNCSASSSLAVSANLR